MRAFLETERLVPRTFASDWPEPAEGSEQGEVGEVGYELTRTAWEHTVRGDTAGERCR